MLPENTPDKRATHAFVIERVKGLTLRDVSVEWDDRAPEPAWGSALVVRDVSESLLTGFRGLPRQPESRCQLSVRNAYKRSCRDEVGAGISAIRRKKNYSSPRPPGRIPHEPKKRTTPLLAGSYLLRGEGDAKAKHLQPKRVHRDTVGAACMAAAVLAQSGAGAKEPAPDAKAILMRMADFLSKSPRMSVTVHSSYDALQAEGDKVEWNDVREVTLSRPDRLRINTQRSDGARSLLVFDGKEITTFDESSKAYAQASHPGSVDDAVVYFVRDLGMRLPFAVLLLSRLPAELEQRVQSVEYVEKTATLSAPAHHIAGRTATVDFQLWIADGDRPAPLRAVLTYKEAPGQPQFRAQFSDWNFDSRPPDSAFTFTPPEGAKKIPFAAALPRVPLGPGGMPVKKGGKR